MNNLLAHISSIDKLIKLEKKRPVILKIKLLIYAQRNKELAGAENHNLRINFNFITYR